MMLEMIDDNQLKYFIEQRLKLWQFFNYGGPKYYPINCDSEITSFFKIRKLLIDNHQFNRKCLYQINLLNLESTSVVQNLYVLDKEATITKSYHPQFLQSIIQNKCTILSSNNFKSDSYNINDVLEFVVNRNKGVRNIGYQLLEIVEIPISDSDIIGVSIFTGTKTNRALIDGSSGMEFIEISKLVKENSNYLEALRKTKEIEEVLKCPVLCQFLFTKDSISIFNIRPLLISQNIIRRWLDRNLHNLNDNLRAAFLLSSNFGVKNDLTLNTSVPPIGTGFANLPRVICGQIIFDVDNIDLFESPILVSRNSHPIDFARLKLISCVIPINGTCTSHSAILAMALGVLYLTELKISDFDLKGRTMIVNNTLLTEGDWLTIDGASGRIFSGNLVNEVEVFDFTKQYFNWLDYKEELPRICINCDDISSLSNNIQMLCDGVGLVRTEHIIVGEQMENLNLASLFQNIDDICVLQEVEKHSMEHISKLSKKFKKKKVVVRLFDFLFDEIKNTESDLKYRPSNPMLADRGVRIASKNPNLYRSQIIGIFKGYRNAIDAGDDFQLSIMLPFVAFAEEVDFWKRKIEICAQEVFISSNDIPEYRFGIMLEQPSIYWQLEEIASKIDFISVGSNDLTQLFFGMSRNDSGDIIMKYQEEGILKENPFNSLKVGGIINFINECAIKVKKINPDIEFGICGLHAGVKGNAGFMKKRIFDYVSIDPNLIDQVKWNFSKETFSQSIEYELLTCYKETKNCQASLNAFSEVKIALEKGFNRHAQNLSFIWSQKVAKSINIDNPLNWKFFKRDLTNYWFGEKEYRRFPPGSDLGQILEYANFINTQNIRVSIFPNDIACHSRSFFLSVKNFSDWRDILLNDYQDYWMEAFPPQIEGAICFRCFLSPDQYFYEFAEGEAMYVFEEEQGAHDIIRVEVEGSIYHSKSTGSMNKLYWNQIEEFLNQNAMKILNISFQAVIEIGIPHISIEGYFYPTSQNEFMIVDMDLPLDIAFV